MEIKVKNTVVTIKFDYLTMFKVDKHLATRNAETNESNNDGVGSLFSKVINKDDSALVDLIKLALPKSAKNVTEDDIIEGIGSYIETLQEEGREYDDIFEDLKQEMVDSGFFKSKILKYISNTEKGRKYLEAKADSEDKELQLQAIDDLIGSMKNALS